MDEINKSTSMSWWKMKSLLTAVKHVKNSKGNYKHVTPNRPLLQPIWHKIKCGSLKGKRVMSSVTANEKDLHEMN